MQSAVTPPALDADWDAPSWRNIEPATITHWYPEGVEHRPHTQAKLQYDDDHLYVHFRVEDRYVRCIRTEYEQPVCRDSCVEFFVEPKPDHGYFNFEINAIGTLLLTYIEDATRTHEGFVKFTKVPWDLAKDIAIRPAFNGPIDPERSEPVTWTTAYRIPLSLFAHYVGDLGHLPGQHWRGNFYKCADESSHPHWGAWAPIGDELNFHQPRQFVALRFGN